MKKLRLFLLALFATSYLSHAADRATPPSAEVLALRYAAVDDAYREIKLKLGDNAATAIVLLDPKRNALAINSAHAEAPSVRALVTTLDQRPPGAEAPSAGRDWLTIETRGVRVDLPREWQPIEQPAKAFTRKRARHPELDIEMNAGAFESDLPVAQYAGVVAASLATNTSAQLDHIAKRVQSRSSDIKEATDSRGGRQIAERVTQAGPSARFELIDVYHQDLADTVQYDVRSKTSAQSKPILYRRDFVLDGVAPHEIIHVTYIGPSEEVFKNQDIIRSIRKERVK